MTTRMTRAMLFGAALLLATMTATAANVIKLKGKGDMKFKDIQWRDSEKAFRVVDMNDVVMSVSRADILDMTVDKPADMGKAEQLVGAGQLDQAIPVLENVARKYQYAIWDGKAREVLIKIYYQKKDPKKAAAEFKKYVDSVPASDVSLELRKGYWDSLIAAGLKVDLKKELDAAAASGNRETMAIAQLMRGNLNRDGGQKLDALLDYLRVVLLYEDIKALQPEALFKAAEMMEELRDPRAAQMKERLRAKYPGSDWAAKAKG